MKRGSDFAIGDTVRIKAGAFSAFTGRIEEVDVTSGKLKVKVTIFGHSTPVDLTFNDVEKVEFSDIDLTDGSNPTNYN